MVMKMKMMKSKMKTFNQSSLASCVGLLFRPELCTIQLASYRLSYPQLSIWLAAVKQLAQIEMQWVEDLIKVEQKNNNSAATVGWQQMESSYPIKEQALQNEPMFCLASPLLTATQAPSYVAVRPNSSQLEIVQI